MLPSFEAVFDVLGVFTHFSSLGFSAIIGFIATHGVANPKGAFGTKAAPLFFSNKAFRSDTDSNAGSLVFLLGLALDDSNNAALFAIALLTDLTGEFGSSVFLFSLKTALDTTIASSADSSILCWFLAISLFCSSLLCFGLL